MDEVDPASADLMLDVAAGAAHLGRRSRRGSLTSARLDLTPEMLEQGRLWRSRPESGTSPSCCGDAVALPWISDQFDLAACRLTLHQVADPRSVVSEMVRVTRPGGRVAVIDLTAPDMRRRRGNEPARTTARSQPRPDPDPGRNPSAARRCRAPRWSSSRSTTSRSTSRTGWSGRRPPPACGRRIRRRFDDELAGGPATGLRPARDGEGVLTLTHTWTLTIAVVAESAGPTR